MAKETQPNINMQDLLNKFVKIGQNKIKSIRRSRNKLLEWYQLKLKQGYYCYFATFTFKEVESFNRKQFTDYLRRVCKVNCYLFADYGSINERFHLHGIIAINYSLNVNSDYFNKYGFTTFRDCSYSIVHYIVKYSVKFDTDYPLFRAIRINLKNS